MTWNLFTTELLLIIVALCEAFVLWRFIVSKNGMLRKLMIAFFAIDIFVYVSSALYFYLTEQGYITLPIDTLRVIILPPKVIIVLFIGMYLTKKQNV